tara:strand:- start:7 stop:243 length:237 start_codon:yes stop_codon:yes gene_type:complete
MILWRAQVFELKLLTWTVASIFMGFGVFSLSAARCIEPKLAALDLILGILRFVLAILFLRVARYLLGKSRASRDSRSA